MSIYRWASMPVQRRGDCGKALCAALQNELGIALSATYMLALDAQARSSMHSFPAWPGSWKLLVN